MSGNSANNDLWTASETLVVRLIARISFAQKEENASIALVTWSASSRVGTRINALVCCFEEDWKFVRLVL